MKPTRPINVTGNPDFRYKNSTQTDISATFARIYKEQKQALVEEVKRANRAELEQILPTVTNVAKLKRG